jgi:uncharacterized protein
MSLTPKTFPHLRFFILLVSFYILNDLFFIFADSYQSWMAIDYLTRIITLGLIYWAYKKEIYPTEHFFFEKLSFWRVSGVLLLFLGPILAIDQTLYSHFGDINRATRLFAYPAITNSTIEMLDLTIGLFVVAFSEEIIFRVYFYRLFVSKLSPNMMVFLSALLFASIHWGTGALNVLVAFIWGAFAMVLFRRLKVIWPFIIAHFLYNYLSFSGVVDLNYWVLF